MNREDYKGYTNYETWVVMHWIDMEFGSYSRWRSRAVALSSPASPEYIKDVPTQKCLLADQLKEEHWKACPKLKGFALDLLNSAMSEVDWFAVAEHLIDATAEEISA
jgi:hypothetical protein